MTRKSLYFNTAWNIAFSLYWAIYAGFNLSEFLTVDNASWSHFHIYLAIFALLFLVWDLSQLVMRVVDYVVQSAFTARTINITVSESTVNTKKPANFNKNNN